MTKLLRKLDFFGQENKIYLNKEEKVTTVVGGILTLLMVAGAIILAWVFGKDIYYKQNPFSYQQPTIYDQYTGQS